MKRLWPCFMAVLVSGCATGNKVKLPIASPTVEGDLSGIKAPIASPTVDGDMSGIKVDAEVDAEVGNVDSEIGGDVGGDVAGTKVIVGAGSSDSVALWLAIVGLVVALIAGPFGGHYYQRVLRPKRLRKEFPGNCGKKPGKPP